MNKLVHFYESTEHRRRRIGGGSHGQSLCSNGDAHQQTSTVFQDVTCQKCIQLLKEDKIYSIIFKKELHAGT